MTAGRSFPLPEEQAEAIEALKSSTWAPVTVVCPAGCRIGEIHETPSGLVWQPSTAGEVRIHEGMERAIKRAKDLLPAPSTTACLSAVMEGRPGDTTYHGACRDHGVHFFTGDEARRKYADARRLRKRRKLCAQHKPEGDAVIRNWKNREKRSEPR